MPTLLSCRCYCFLSRCRAHRAGPHDLSARDAGPIDLGSEFVASVVGGQWARAAGQKAVCLESFRLSASRDMVSVVTGHAVQIRTWCSQCGECCRRLKIQLMLKRRKIRTRTRTRTWCSQMRRELGVPYRDEATTLTAWMLESANDSVTARCLVTALFFFFTSNGEHRLDLRHRPSEQADR